MSPIAYQTPRTWTTGELVTAAMMNQEVRDNLNAAFPDGVGAWTAYTPTFTNVTVGSGTVTGAFIRLGRTVFFRARFTFGSGSAVSGAVAVTLPVTSIAAIDESIIGECEFIDANGAWTAGVLQIDTPTTARVWVLAAGGTYATFTALSSSVPMTWAAGDFLDVKGRYEAAS